MRDRLTPQTPEQQAKPPTYFRKDRSDFVEWIGGRHSRILEVGCGAGANAPLFRRLSGERLVGVELDKQSAAAALLGFDEVHACRIEDVLSDLEGPFDLIVCADVLEHLSDPWTVLAGLRQLAHESSNLAVSIPNVRNYRALARIAFGSGFHYESEGTFDRTHLRFFTRQNIADMLTETGWTPVRWSGSRVGRLAPALHRLAWIAADRADEYLNYQWYVIAQPAQMTDRNAR